MNEPAASVNEKATAVNAPAAAVNAPPRYRLGRVTSDAETPRRCEAPKPKRHCDPHNDVACYRAETIDPDTGVVRRRFFCLRAAGAWAYARGVAFPPGMWTALYGEDGAP
jgi:hypothetical protein